MDVFFAAAGLKRGAALIASLVDGVDDATALRSPPRGGWSLLEVTCHLLDEEREDFRVRLEYILRESVSEPPANGPLANGPPADWPPIDPEGWPVERRYRDQDLATVLAAWRDEREQSISWLLKLGDPDWARTIDHPVLGRLSAGDLMTSWLDHDLLHARQMLAIHHANLTRRAAPYGADYAGGRWTD